MAPPPKKPTGAAKYPPKPKPSGPACALTGFSSPSAFPAFSDLLIAAQRTASDSACPPAYQINIVGPRNRYMHEAGSLPASEGQITQILSEMHTCLTEAFAL